MFILPQEMKSVMYAYQLNAITENDETIVNMAIASAEAEMKSYLNPSNQRQWSDGRPLYDVKAIFAAVAEDRNPLIVELCKDIACYRICRLANMDMIHEQVKERYDRAIDWLKSVAGFSGTTTLAPDLPILDDSDDKNTAKAFRAGSRDKFNHE